MTKKPYYKLTVGRAPYTSADMRFPSGRIRIEVSDAYPDTAKVVADLCDIRWSKACRKVLDFFDAAPPGVRLTEPADRPLRAEVAALETR